MINIVDKSKCCGCSACASICPKQCISMVEDNEGFLYPQVKASICIECGICEKVCPEIHVKEKAGNPIAYVIQNKDMHVLRDSTSGGFYTSLANYIIALGGGVFGALFNDKFEVIHSYSNSYEGITLFRGSKYVQSKIEDTYKLCKKLLSQNRIVCFSGTPCQIQGLISFLKGNNKNLITVDVVCRGVPSPKFFREYRYFREKEYGANISKIKFRDKYYGYQYSTLSIEFSNKKYYHVGMEADPMLSFFFKGMCSRPSCHNCSFKSISRISDFTIHDCWHATKFDKKFGNKGATMLYIHTPKGESIFEKIKPDFIYKACDYKQAALYDGIMIENCAIANPLRTQFFKDFNSLPMKQLIQKYYPMNGFRKLKIILKPLLYRLGFFFIYMKLKKIALP